MAALMPFTVSPAFFAMAFRWEDMVLLLFASRVAIWELENPHLMRSATFRSLSYMVHSVSMSSRLQNPGVTVSISSLSLLSMSSDCPMHSFESILPLSS